MKANELGKLLDRIYEIEQLLQENINLKQRLNNYIDDPIIQANKDIEEMTNTYMPIINSNENSFKERTAFLNSCRNLTIKDINQKLECYQKQNKNQKFNLQINILKRLHDAYSSITKIFDIALIIIFCFLFISFILVWLTNDLILYISFSIGIFSTIVFLFIVIKHLVNDYTNPSKKWKKISNEIIDKELAKTLNTSLKEHQTYNKELENKKEEMLTSAKKEQSSRWEKSLMALQKIEHDIEEAEKSLKNISISDEYLAFYNNTSNKKQFINALKRSRKDFLADDYAKYINKNPLL